MSKPAHHLLAGALTAPLLLLAACGSGQHPVPDPPVSPSAPSSSASPPEHESPEAFIRRWAEAEKRMENTGVTAQYQLLSAGCLPCLSLIRDVKRFYRNGGFIKWGGLRVISVVKRGRQHGGAMGFAVTTDSSPTHYKESAHSPLRTLKGGITHELVSLKRVRGQYVVVARSRLAT
jgi:hypothetical protein